MGGCKQRVEKSGRDLETNPRQQKNALPKKKKGGGAADKEKMTGDAQGDSRKKDQVPRRFQADPSGPGDHRREKGGAGRARDSS